MSGSTRALVPVNTGPIDMESLAARERAEAEAFTKTDRRFRMRKERTALISFRLRPEVRAKLERMADAEGTSMVAILERSIDLLDRLMRGEKP